MPAKKKFISQARLKRFVAIYWITKRTQNGCPLPKSVLVPFACKPELCSVAMFYFLATNRMQQNNLGPYPKFVIIFGLNKITAPFIGLVATCTYS
jgi:hypothetical protein